MITFRQDSSRAKSMGKMLILLVLLPSVLQASPVTTESSQDITTVLPSSAVPLAEAIPALPLAIPVPKSVVPAMPVIPPQPRIPGVPLRPDGFPAVWTLLPNATEEEIAASLESSLLGLHRGADMLIPLSDPQLRDSREMHSGVTEKYPWQNPWYSDYGKFRKNNDPVFDHNMVTNVTAQLGGTAFLHCRVRNLGERPVSWVRRRDWHILTSGVFTYTNDERFQVAHTEGSDDWTLQIKYVQKRDNGTYECQVATGAGTMSHYFNLHIVVPEAFILGSGEYHIGEGSTISLVCIIENSPAPPQYVFWYHNDRMINYDTSRGGVTVSTEPGPKTHSRLIINEATHGDSGNYSCRASNTEPDFIQVFVSKGDKMAAIQRQETSGCSDLAPPEILTIILVFSALLSRVLDWSSR